MGERVQRSEPYTPVLVDPHEHRVLAVAELIITLVKVTAWWWEKYIILLLWGGIYDGSCGLAIEIGN